MPTFVAVQCFQCSTMQVKQQKKSSKWSCVVCNEKQSVRKVFAQSLAAKDVRHFVQSFNMSRQISEQHQQFTSEKQQGFDSQSNGQKTTEKKRTDWKEYMDDDDDSNDVSGRHEEGDKKLTQGDGFYPMFVTEMPKPVFKKPKLKEYPTNNHCTDKLFKPLFRSRSNANKRHGTDQPKDNPQSMDEFEQTSGGRGAKTKMTDFTEVEGICTDEEAIGLQSNRDSKWCNFRAQFQDQNSNSNIMKEAIIQPPTKEVDRSVSTTQYDGNFTSGMQRSGNGPVSKWASFITNEDDDYDLRTDSWDHVGQDKNNVVKSLLNDEKVEDDIHPDFL